MFTIYNGNTAFEQWALDQLVTCSCLQEGDEVVFRAYGKTYATTAFEQDGIILADVPNFLLQKAGSIRVDLGWGLDCHMDCRTDLVVKKRDKPTDYTCPYNIKPRSKDNVGGATSLEDLLPAEVILEETALAFVEDMDGYAFEPTASIIAGDEYTVTYNGTDYVCTALEEVDDDGSTIHILGNYDQLTGTGDSGEPFIIMVVEEMGMIAPFDGSTEVTLSITKQGKIPTKYLPEHLQFGEVEEVVSEPLNITWDGNTEGLASLELDRETNSFLYRVSNAMPTIEQLQSGTLSVRDPIGVIAEAVQISEFNINSVEDVYLFLACQYPAASIMVVYDEDEMGAPKGLYVSVYGGAIYVSSLTTTEPVEQSKTVVKTIDLKYLPIEELKAALGIGNEQ